jgi:hypothetical protein
MTAWSAFPAVAILGPWILLFQTATRSPSKRGLRAVSMMMMQFLWLTTTQPWACTLAKSGLNPDFIALSRHRFENKSLLRTHAQ